MSELEKNKAGLQKKVSSVFKGVPLPQGSAARQTPEAPTSDQIRGGSAKPTAPDRQPQSSLMKKLHQADEKPGNPIANGAAKAGPESAPVADRKQRQPAAKEIHETRMSLKKAASARQSKVAPLAEPAGPNLWRQINNKLFAPKPGVSPSRQKAMVILVPILAIIMIFAFRQVLSTSPHKTQAATDNETLPPLEAKPDGQVDWQIPEPLPATLRDPIRLVDHSAPNSTEPNGTAAEPKTKVINVRDIIYSKDKPSAFINGRIVYVGDKIGGTTIMQINKNSIEFEKDGKKWVKDVRD
jgi:hypothetical protein